MTPWLTVIGLGEGGLADLSPHARALLAGAELVVGGERHLALVPDGGRGVERWSWDTPLKRTVERLATRRGRPTVVLASGDPLLYGVGVTLSRAVPAAEMTVIPAPSSFSLAAARLAWPLAEVDCLTLHGRPVELLNAAVAPGARLLLLAQDGATPAAVARHLVSLGYPESRIVVFETMGGAAERRHEATAAAWRVERTADLNTIAVECIAGPGAVVRPCVPGLPDEAFRHDGQLTKREVRAATLAALMPLPGQRLWDVGAGSGAVAIEWMRCGRTLAAVAVERDAVRLDLIADNARALGVPLLRIVAGAAPEALADLPAPDAVFLGGGLTGPGVVERCWQALGPGGRFVANAVTLEGEARLLELHERIGGVLTRIAVSRAEPVGGFTGWKPLMPVTQLAAVKPR